MSREFIARSTKVPRSIGQLKLFGLILGALFTRTLVLNAFAF
jgi:hypothetical protein